MAPHRAAQKPAAGGQQQGRPLREQDARPVQQAHAAQGSGTVHRRRAAGQDHTRQTLRHSQRAGQGGDTPTRHRGDAEALQAQGVGELRHVVGPVQEPAPG